MVLLFSKQLIAIRHMESLSNSSRGASLDTHKATYVSSGSQTHAINELAAVHNRDRDFFTYTMTHEMPLVLAGYFFSCYHCTFWVHVMDKLQSFEIV